MMVFVSDVVELIDRLKLLIDKEIDMLMVIIVIMVMECKMLMILLGLRKLFEVSLNNVISVIMVSNIFYL